MAFLKKEKKEDAPRTPLFRGERIPGGIQLGIKGQSAFEGDHIAYFWETESEFEDALEFLEIGVRNGDHCVVFGHTDANLRVLDLLKKRVDVDALQTSGRLTVIGGQRSGDKLLSSIAADFEKALAGGAKMLRLLGNIGWGKPDWPDEDSMLQFEATVTGAVRQLPAVVVCMYDVRAATGRVMFRGAFETHPLTFCRNVLRENPHYVRVEDFVAALVRK